MVPATEFGPTYSQQKFGLFSPHHKYHARTNAVSTETRIVFPHHKYVADQQPTDRQFRYSNRPIRCSTQLNRYYGHYHEQYLGIPRVYPGTKTGCFGYTWVSTRLSVEGIPY